LSEQLEFVPPGLDDLRQHRSGPLFVVGYAQCLDPGEGGSQGTRIPVDRGFQQGE
jgi:hypothetical protein